MDYEEGTRLNKIIDQGNEASVERALILKVLEKVEPSKYKQSVEELKKEINKQ